MMVKYHLKETSVNVPHRCQRIDGFKKFLLSATMILPLALWSLPVSAATFNVTTEADFRQRIIDANNSADPSSTIDLIASFSIADPTAFTALTKTLIINTNSFPLRGASASPAISLVFSGGALTLNGELAAGNISAANNSAGGGITYSDGIMINNAILSGGVGGSKGGSGGIGLQLTSASLTNTSTITGGNGGIYINETTGSSLYGNSGGAGLQLTGGNLDNSGIITGGVGGGFSGGNRDNKWGGSGGGGVFLTGGAHSNSGKISGGAGGVGSNQGTDTGNGDGGLGLNLSGGAELTNFASGEIVGSNGRAGGGGSGGSGGGDGVVINGSKITNFGSIIGGSGTGTSSTNGAFGINGKDSIIINAGTIKGGRQGNGGQEAAISFSGGNNILELWAGSSITGNVLASSGDTFVLGGAANSSFNTSSIGSAAQYRNFEKYEKTGLSTWTLTGSTTTIAPWIIREGVLQISTDAQLGAASGVLTFNGGTLATTASFSSNRSVNLAANATILTAAGTTLTLTGPLSGAGGLSKGDAGVLAFAVPSTIQGNVSAAAGTLAFRQTGVFQVGGSYSTQDGATTSVGLAASLAIAGSFTQTANSTLTFDLGSVDPIISANSVTLGGNLIISSLNNRRTASSVNNTKITLIRSATAITGDFANVDTSVINVTRDYVTLLTGIAPNTTDYDIALQLRWLTGLSTGAGDFTLAAGEEFDVDLSLPDRAAAGTFASGWDGSSLYKKGDGTLILSAANNYTGVTQVSSGAIILRANQALGFTSNLDMFAGTVVDLSGTRQLSGALHTDAGSRLLFNGGTLTITDAQRLLGDNSGGMIENDTLFGPGSLVIDPSIMPVNGIQPGFAGTVTVTGGSTLVLNNAAAFNNAVGAGGSVGIGINIASSADKLIFGDLALHTTSTVTGVTSGIAAMVITGNGQVQVLDGMTVIMTGNNGYTGGTNIAATSILQLGDGAGGGTSGWITADVLNEGTLIFNRADANVFTGVISGNGALTHIGNGTTTLTAASTYSGPTTISAGILAAGAANIFSQASSFRTDPGGQLALSGFNQTLSSLDNAGAVNFGGGSGTILTIVGDYTSNGGQLIYNSVLSNSGVATDQLVAGSVVLGAGGATRIYINQTGGLGGLTVGDGVKIVHVNGGSSASASGAFVLGRPVKAGAYEYQLYQNGTNIDGNWYLRSSFDNPSGPYRPEVPGNMASPGLAARFGLAMLGTFDERITAQFGAKPSKLNDVGHANAAWGRVFGATGQVDFANKSTRMASFLRNGPSYDYDFGGFQTGMDIYRNETQSGSQNIFGLYVGAGRVDGTVKRVVGGRAGTVNMDSYSLGAYWTYRDARGWYIDNIAQATFYNAMKTISIDGLSASSNGNGLIGSTEIGYAIPLGGMWTITPQAQLVYQHLSLGTSRDTYGTVKYKDSDLFYGRIGGRLSKDWDLTNGQSVTTYAYANVWHGGGEKAKTLFNTLNGTYVVPLRSDIGGTWGQAGFGFSSQINKNISAFGAADYSFSVDRDNHSSVGGKLGLMLNW